MNLPSAVNTIYKQLSQDYLFFQNNYYNIIYADISFIFNITIEGKGNELKLQLFIFKTCTIIIFLNQIQSYLHKIIQKIYTSFFYPIILLLGIVQMILRSLCDVMVG